MMKFVGLLAAILLAGVAQDRKAPPEGVEFERDIVYGRGAGEDLRLNLARPKGAAGPLPCLVVIHGGGWASGRREQHDDLTWQAALRGYVSATVSYRLVPRHLFPAAVEDVKCAVRFLRAHADRYGIDPGRIGATGFSAGGHLSLMLGVMGKEDGLEGEGGWGDQPSQVNAVVNFFGPADFAGAEFPPASRGLVRNFLGGSREEKAEQYRRASPVTYVSRGDAPVLIFQGTKDPLVPHSQACLMVEALTAAGVPGRVELIVGAGHGWGGAELARTMEAAFAFFDRHLQGKK